MENKENQKRHFDFATVFGDTKKYIDDYNTKQNRLTDKINANQRATAELIIRLYLKQLNQAGSLGMLDIKKLPGFTTYNSSLAGCKGCTKRTIINHKERLKASGFIVKEEHRGGTGIELWVNPQILGIANLSTKAVDNATETRDVPSIFYGNVKNFHPLVHELQEHNNINSSVDKLSGYHTAEERSGVRSAHHHGLAGVPTNLSAAAQAAGTGHEPYKNTQKSAAPVLPKEKSSEKNLEKGSAQKQKLSPEKKHEQISGGAGRLFLLSLVRQFWEYAKASLYPDIILSEPEEREILNLIWESVYGKFRLKATEKEWLNFQESAITRIDMVTKWLSRSCTHWIPKPHLYFHPNNNRNGFKKTWEWYLRQETLKLEVRNQLALQRAKHELTQHSQGKGRFKDKSRLQLFRIHEKRLRQYKDQALMHAYHTCLQQSLHLQILV